MKGNSSRLKVVEDRLNAVEEGLDQVKGFSKEIDHVLARTVVIENHLGIKSVKMA